MCFSAAWVAEFFILLIVIGGAMAIFRIVWPLIAAQLGSFGPYAAAVLQIIKVVIICLILIWIVWFAVDAFSCLLGGGGARFPRLVR